MRFLKNILSSLTALLIFTLVIILILVAVIASKKVSYGVEIKNNSILEINVNDGIVDREVFSESDIINPTHSKNDLISIVKALKEAKNDTLIKGVLLRIGDLKGSLANVSSLKRNLTEFKNTGRKVIVYSEYLSQVGYYLASSADSIFVNSLSSVEWKGLGAQVIYFKSMLERIGVKAEPIRAGKFKSAIEPFVLDTMSMQNQYQLSQMLNDIWGNIIFEVSNERGLSPSKLDSIANFLGFLLPNEAIKNGLVDGIKYEDEIISSLDQMVGGKCNLISISDYNASTNRDIIAKSKVVVVNAEGSIVDANTDSDISSIRYSKIFEEILNDKDVKAVVLRINSPGGSALASEKIWRKLNLISSKLPLIVSMGNYAASGGYYMACAGDTILAEKNTITGSIGVFGLMFNFSKLINEIGIKVEKVKTNEMSDFPSFDRGLSEKEKNRIHKGINSIYLKFKERVGMGRSLTKNDVDKLAEGRVWTGSQALKLGLVDQIGGLEKAISIAVSAAKLKNYKLIHLPMNKTPLEVIANKLTQQTKFSFPEPFSKYNFILQNPEFFKSFSKPQARLPYVISID